MRLTQFLLKPKRKPQHMGFDRFLGRRGKTKQVIMLPNDVRKAKNDLKIEEENMLYLRNPYLTFQQSFGHAGALGKYGEFKGRMMTQDFLRKSKPHVLVEDRLVYALMNKDNWDT